MKRIVIPFLILMSVIIFVACGKKKHDFSGTYYYMQNLESHEIHKIVIRKDMNNDDKIQKYIIGEESSIQQGTGISEGTMTADEELMSISLSKPSSELAGQIQYGPSYDISKAKAIPYFIEEYGFSIGDKENKNRRIEFYRDSSSLGKRYQNVWTARSSYENEFGK